MASDNPRTTPLKPPGCQHGSGVGYQIATLLSEERYSLSAGLRSNARYHASIFGTTPSTRNRRGEWTSLTNWSLNASSRGFPLQDCAYARKKRWSPVYPSITG